MSKVELKDDEERLLAQVIDACQQVIGKALRSPSEALGIAVGLDSALTTLKLVASEAARGEAGASHIVAARESLTRGALSDVLALAKDPQTAAAALAAVSTVAPGFAASAVAPPRPVSTAPHFGEVSQAYIDMRIGIDGADHPEIAICGCADRPFSRSLATARLTNTRTRICRTTSRRCSSGRATRPSGQKCRTSRSRRYLPPMPTCISSRWRSRL